MYKIGLRLQTQKITSWKKLHYILVNLNLLLRHHLSLSQALDVLYEATDPSDIKLLLQRIKQQVSQGITLAHSLQNISPELHPFYYQLINLGEQHSVLVDVIELLAHHGQQHLQLKRTIKKNCAYPIVIISLSLILFLFIIVYTLPQFAKLYASTHLTLPSNTQHLLMIASWVKQYWKIILGLLSSFIGVVVFMGYQGKLKFNGFRLAYHLPAARNLVIHYHCLLLTQTLHLSLIARADLISSLHALSSLLPHPNFQHALFICQNQLRAGQSLGSTLKESECFPSLLCSLVTIAEQTGTLQVTCEYLATHYAGKVQDQWQKLISCINPILLSVAASFILVLIISIYQPILNLSSQVAY